MIKKRNLYCLVVISLFILATTSCSEDIYGGMDINGNQTSLTVVEAKAFFEAKMSYIYQSQAKSTLAERGLGIDPGEFTADWKNTKTTSNKYVETVNADIRTEYTYLFSGDLLITDSSIVKVYQKLMVVRTKATGNMSSYIMNVIPLSNVLSD